MFDFLLIGQAIGVVDKYFKEEAFEEDFWEITRKLYPNLESAFSFMVDPRKLKDRYVESAEILIMTQKEKNSVLKAFTLLRRYSEELAKDADLNERLVFAKSFLPSIFFNQEPCSEECKIIPFPSESDRLQ